MSSMSMMSPPMSPPTTALMMAGMMVAMMLPSVAPTLWRHHRHLRAARVRGAGEWTTYFAVGYVSVWVAISLALFAMTAKLSPIRMASATDSPFPPWAGAVVLFAGALQRSRWKAKQLLRCREACVTIGVITAWRGGCRLGADCVLSCAAPMAILFAAGLMDVRMMLVITAAITAERLAPDGVRIARLTGALALVAGLVMCV